MESVRISCISVREIEGFKTKALNSRQLEERIEIMGIHAFGTCSITSKKVSSGMLDRRIKCPPYVCFDGDT